MHLPETPSEFGSSREWTTNLANATGDGGLKTSKWDRVAFGKVNVTRFLRSCNLLLEVDLNNLRKENRMPTLPFLPRFFVSTGSFFTFFRGGLSVSLSGSSTFGRVTFFFCLAILSKNLKV